MARDKKNESVLTPEGKLAQALVPDWEQVYKVPENWCWTTLKNVSDIIMGQSPAGTDTTDDSSYIPLIGGAADMGELYPKATRYTKVPTKISYVDDIILCIRATLGRPIYSDGEYCLGRGVAAIRSTILSKEFLRFFFINQEQYLYDHATGTTFAQVNSDTLSQMPIALPPLAEQQRIVECIEYLFAKLDETKEKVQSVLDSFETRKAAILHKTFTGELTAKWRVERGLGMDGWKHAKFSDVLDVRDGTHDSPQYYEAGYPLVTSKNLKDGQITDKDIKYICQADYDKINERSKVDIGDILFAMIGTIGNPVVVQVEPKFAIKNMALFKNIGKIDPHFVKYYLESKAVVDKMKNEAKGSTQKFVALGYLRAFPISVPTEAEQTEIVRILDSLFAKEQQAKETAEAVLEQIDLLKKSILARAFRGELGTNDPSEESAVELLKRVLESDAPAETKKRSKSVPKELQEKLETELERKIIHLYFQRETESLPAEVLLSVSSKKFDVLEAIHNLEHRGLVKKLNNGNYRLLG